MNLKKLFTFEFLMGLAFAAAVLIIHIYWPDVLQNTMTIITASILFLIITQVTHQTIKNLSQEEKDVFNKSYKAAAIVFGIFLFLLLVNAKNVEHGIFGYSYFYLLAFYVIAQSASGFYFLKRAKLYSNEGQSGERRVK